MTSYERIRVDGKTLILRDPKEITFLGVPALSGIEVDREGDEVAPRGVDMNQHVIQLALITRRTPLVMNLHYGTLEDAPTR